MKKIDLITKLGAFIILFISCSTSKHTGHFNKTINGNWQLKTIVSEGVTGKINSKVFNEADFNCFIGSNWTFDGHKNLGNYVISKNANECAALKRNISWAIDEADGQAKQFRFTRLDNSLKVLDNNSGEFRFTIEQLDNNSIQLRSETIVDGKTASLIYHFVRI